VARRKRDPAEASAEPSPGLGGPWSQARSQALQLAATQATNAEILAALRAVFCACRPQQLTPADLARSFATWLDDLDDARVAGRLATVVALQAGATSGDAYAAGLLLRRQEALDDIDRKLLAEVKRLMTLEPHEIVEELARLQEQLGAT